MTVTEGDKAGSVTGTEGDGTNSATVTAVVLTLDEEAHLADCLHSLDWAEATLVLDSGSRDATADIAREHGARVEHRDFTNYSRQRNAALELVASEWTLFVDADERVPPELAAEIRSVVGEDRDPAAYRIPRVNLFWGRQVKGGGWWPDHQTRLMRTRQARYDPDRAVHEVPEVDGSVGTLRAPLIHINYASWDEFWDKQRRYALMDAKRRHAEGWRLRPWSPISLPLREGWRRFVTLGGWRDGWLGVRLAAAMAYFEWVTVQAMRRPG